MFYMLIWRLDGLGLRRGAGLVGFGLFKDVLYAHLVAGRTGPPEGGRAGRIWPLQRCFICSFGGWADWASGGGPGWSDLASSKMFYMLIWWLGGLGLRRGAGLVGFGLFKNVLYAHLVAG